MSKSLANILSAVGAGFAGYGKGKMMYNEDQRAQKREARLDQQADFQQQAQERQQADWTREDTEREQVKQAAAPRTVVDKQDTSLPLPMQVPKYEAGGQTFDDEAAAKQAIAGQNSKQALNERLAATMAQQGKHAEAQRYQQLADQAREEGSAEFLSGILSNAPKAEALKQSGGKLVMPVPAQLADPFNQTGGKWQVGPDHQIEYFAQPDGTVNARVLGKDGREILGDVANGYRFLMTPKEKLAFDASEKRENARIAEAERDRADTKEYRNATLALDGRRVSATEAATKRAEDREERLAKAEGTKAERESEKEERKADAKAADDYMSDWRAQNPDATPAQHAAKRSEAIAAVQAARRNAQVQDALRSDFHGKAFGSKEYASTYNEAIDHGLTPDALKAMGYQPPAQQANGSRASRAGASPAKVAAGTGTGPVPTPRKDEGARPGYIPKEHPKVESPYEREQKAERAAEAQAEAKRRAQDIAVLKARIAANRASPRVGSQMQINSDQRRLDELLAGG